MAVITMSPSPAYVDITGEIGDPPIATFNMGGVQLINAAELDGYFAIQDDPATGLSQLVIAWPEPPVVGTFGILVDAPSGAAQAFTVHVTEPMLTIAMPFLSGGWVTALDAKANRVIVKAAAPKGKLLLAPPAVVDESGNEVAGKITYTLPAGGLFAEHADGSLVTNWQGTAPTGDHQITVTATLADGTVQAQPYTISIV